MPGLPKSIIKQYGISKKAWSVFRGRSRPKSKTRSVKSMARRRRYSPRRRWFKRRGGRKSKSIPLAPVLGFASIFAMSTPRGPTLIDDISRGDINGFLYDARERLLGVDNVGKFHWEWVAETYTPVIVGGLVHWAASKFGINRYLKRIPMIGKYISI